MSQECSEMGWKILALTVAGLLFWKHDRLLSSAWEVAHPNIWSNMEAAQKTSLVRVVPR